MQSSRAFIIDPSALATSPEPADRLVLFNHFVPFALPLDGGDWPYALSASQVDLVARAASRISSVITNRSNLPKGVIERAQSWRNRSDTDWFITGDSEDLSPTQPTTQIEALLGTEFGWLFLDRTRLRPAGFALGEHLTSLSLAPGEEVTIEQRSFTKTERAFEDARENELSTDLEFSSTYATELSESFDWQMSAGRKRTEGSGQKVSGNYEGVGVEASAQQANDLNDGDNRTARNSVKRSETTSRKVAAKQRRQHKTILKISQENRFESGSKRVLRNTNALAPIDLVYFKIQQRLQLFHERYGVRLCWAPTVAKPGKAFRDRLAKRHRELVDAAKKSVDPGPTPIPPTSPISGNAQTGQAIEIAGRFDPVWGGQSADYEINIAAPSNYTWDGQAPILAFSFTGNRPAVGHVLTFGRTALGVRMVVHVGVADCRNPFQPAFWESQGTATLTCSANFIPMPNPAADQAYATAFAAYTSQLADYNARKNLAEAAAVAEAEAAWEKERAVLIENVDSTTEIIGTLIEQAFPAQVRDDPWELDLWERIFDLPRVTIKFYPSWWNGPALEDPKSPADSFTNASWARIYLPIRPDAEAQALRWLVERKLYGQGSAQLEAAIAKLERDLAAYRLTNFGTPDESPLVTGTMVGACHTIAEQVKCLGFWEDVVPTDGTHLEVLQATSSAADDASKARLDADRLRAEQEAVSQGHQAAVLGTIAGASLADLQDHVTVHIGGPTVQS